MKRIVLCLSLAAIALAGCAKRPGSIKPAMLPATTFTSLDCGRLAHELAAEKETLTKLSRKQNDAATGDAFGVFLIGVPMASLAGGDNEGDIAVSKGRIEALENARLIRSCR